jgi:hypothetical protein
MYWSLVKMFISDESIVNPMSMVSALQVNKKPTLVLNVKLSIS